MRDRLNWLALWCMLAVLGPRAVLGQTPRDSGGIEIPATWVYDVGIKDDTLYFTTESTSAVGAIYKLESDSTAARIAGFSKPCISLGCVEDTLFVGLKSIGKVLRSDDEGASWDTTGQLGGVASVYALLRDSSGVFYAATGDNNGDIFRAVWNSEVGGSVLSGPTWTYGLTSHGSILYATTDFDTSELWKSSDTGRTWSRVNQNFPGTRAYDVFWDQETMYVGLNNSRGVWRSTDAGTSWDSTPTPPGASDAYCFTKPQGRDFLIGTGNTNGDIFQACYPMQVGGGELSGPHWTNDVTAHASTLFACTDFDTAELWRSTDTAQTWSRINRNFPGSQLRAMHWDGDTAYVGMNNSQGIWRTIDAGTTWDSVVKPDGVSDVYQFCQPQAGEFLIGTGNSNGDIFRAQFTMGLGGAELAGSRWVHDVEPWGSSLWAGAGTDSALVWRTTDSGESWQKMGRTSGNNALTITPWGRNLYAGTDSGGNVYVSYDTAKTWHETGDLPGATKTYSLFESGHAYPGKLMAATGDDSGDVSVSDSAAVQEDVVVWLPDSMTGIVGDTVLVPILISGQEDDGVYSADITLRFGESVLTATGGFDSGDVAHGWSIDANPFSDSLVIGMAGADPLGAGDTLLYVKMLVDAADTTTVWFERCLLNEGNVPCTTHAGIFYGAPRTKSISGTVEYYRGTEEGIPDVRLVLSGDADDTTYTDTAGYYAFTVIAGYGITVTPERSSESREPAVSAYDASLVLQHAVHKVTLDSLQCIAGDVSGRGGVTGYDASFILKYAVGIVDHFPVGYRSGLDTVDWAFRPPQRDYDSLISDQENQDYTGILYGDPSGNWSASNMLAAWEGMATAAPRSCFSLNLPESEFTNADAPAVTERSSPALGPSIVFPIVARGARGLISADALVRYDAERYTLRGVQTTAQTEGYMVAASDKDGYVRIAMAGTEKLDGNVQLVELVFEPADQTARDAKTATAGAAQAQVTGNLTSDGNRVPKVAPTSHSVSPQPSVQSPKSLAEIVWLAVNEGKTDAAGQTGEGAMGEEKKLPAAFYLAPPKPNPFGNGTSISYGLPFASEVELCVFDVTGKKVHTLVDGMQSAGRYSPTWDGRDAKGQRLASGLYFVRMKIPRFRLQHKITLLHR